MAENLPRLKISDDNKVTLAMRVKKIFEDRRGLLAADERPETLDGKFTDRTITNSPEKRAEFRECLFSTPSLEHWIGGVILNEETFGQDCTLNTGENGSPIIDILKAKRIEIGVKVDKGLMDFGSGEKISYGIEDLENRLKDKKIEMATFCKWRAVFTLSERFPTDQCIDQNCILLAKYAVIAQQCGKVPIVEPEISFEGIFTAEEMAEAAKRVYVCFFMWANRMGVFLPGTILKCSFITEGSQGEKKADLGLLNVSTLADCVPCALGAVVFLSGGHSAERSFELLSQAHTANSYRDLRLSFSFCRALTEGALEAWAGEAKNVEKAHKVFMEALERCRKANAGGYAKE